MKALESEARGLILRKNLSKAIEGLIRAEKPAQLAFAGEDKMMRAALPEDRQRRKFRCSALRFVSSIAPET